MKTEENIMYYFMEGYSLKQWAGKHVSVKAMNVMKAALPEAVGRENADLEKNRESSQEEKSNVLELLSKKHSEN